MNSNPRQIPSELENIFEKLRWEVATIHLRWTLYRQLYGANPKRVELLNETAALFFNQLQLILIEDTVLGLARLTDPTKSAKRETLVLEQLYKGLNPSEYPTLCNRMNQLLKSIRNKCTPFRKYRNRRFAHRDLKTALNAIKNSLPGFSREMVESVLMVIRMFMNEFEKFFSDSETVYQQSVALGDADKLVLALKKAFEYDLLKRDGKIPFDHLQKSKYWTS